MKKTKTGSSSALALGYSLTAIISITLIASLLLDLRMPDTVWPPKPELGQPDNLSTRNESTESPTLAPATLENSTVSGDASSDDPSIVPHRSGMTETGRSERDDSAKMTILTNNTNTESALNHQRKRLSPDAVRQIQILQREKASRTAAQRKVDPRLLYSVPPHLGHAAVPEGPQLHTAVDMEEDLRVEVDIEAEISDRLLMRIEELGGEIVNYHPRFRAIRARLPLHAIERLAAEDRIRSIHEADTMFTNTKINTSEGDIAHAVDLTRMEFDVNGSGVKIGVLSDSVDHLTSLQSSGDLPSQVTVLPGQSSAGTSEGTAMLEIIHDLASGADLYFATAFGGQAQFAQNILDLRAHGCDVIVDDVGYFAEPVFQDGVIAQAVNEVVDDGAVYFSAAGNSGNLNDGSSGVWEGDFVPGHGLGSTFNDFGDGILYNVISVDSPSFFTLQWSDAMGESGNDYDLLLLDPTLTRVVAISNRVQDGDDNPFEWIDSRQRDHTGYFLAIIRSRGESRYVHLNAHRGRLRQSTYGQIYGHAAATSAIAVAAIDAALAGNDAFDEENNYQVETFSSDGPRRVFYSSDGIPITPGDFLATGGEVRAKPDLVAADGVATATPRFHVFYGTSAAAPHAAAIAALIIEQGINTPELIREALTATAMDIEHPGFDRDSGFGIIDAVAAVGYAGTRPPADADEDGLPDAYEEHYFGNSIIAVPDEDNDGDGWSNLDEYLADTDPRNSSSFFKIVGLSAQDQVALQFYSSLNRVYTLQQCDNPSAAHWEDVPGKTKLKGSGGMTLYYHAKSSQAMCYRILVAVR